MRPSVGEWIREAWCMHTEQFYSAPNEGRAENTEGAGGYHSK